MEQERDDLTLLVDADSLIYFVAHLETVEEAILKLDERVYNILKANDTIFVCRHNHIDHEKETIKLH